MELFVFAAAAVGLLALIALMSPGVERGRRPIRTMVGQDERTRRQQRASFAAQLAEREAPRPQWAPVYKVAPQPQWAPVYEVAPRPEPARQVAQPRGVNQRERRADGLVASLLGPTARA